MKKFSETKRRERDRSKQVELRFQIRENECEA